MTDLQDWSMTTEQRNKFNRIQKYKKLLEHTPYLEKFQRIYGDRKEGLLNYIILCEIIVVKGFELKRDNQVFLNTLERLYTQKENFLG
jgi:hypothetical protein